MKKKISLLLCLFLTVLSLSGCGMAFDMEGSVRKNGSGKFVITYGYTKDFLDGILEMSDGMSDEEAQKDIYDNFKKRKINGETYYCISGKYKFKKSRDLERVLTDYKFYNKKISIEEGGELTDSLFETVYAAGDSFVGYPKKESYETMSDTSEYEGMGETNGEELDVYMEFSLSFDKKIVSTNGKLSADKKTVTWSLKQLQSGKKLYAYTTKTRSSIKVNVANNKSYKKSVTIRCKSGKGAMYLDGKLISSGKVVKKAGKHVLTTVGQNGKKKTIKFRIKK